MLIKYLYAYKMEYDFLIVGAGLSGSTLAERLASAGNTICVVEKRNHIGGNIYDELDENGVLVHKYGPHLFHTNSKEVFSYLSEFTEWRDYEHKVLAYINGKYVPFPINRTTLNLLYGLNLKTEADVSSFLDSVRKPNIEIKNARDAVVAKVGEDLYSTFFEGYTKKQWGVDPTELSPEVTQRIPIRTNTDDRYFTDIYQAMPKAGYTEMIKRMLSHKNINIQLNTDYKDMIESVKYNNLIYTGPIDYFFDYKFGKLRYRSLVFKRERHNVEFYQNATVINYPDGNIPYTRCVEIKHATGQKISKTTVVYEYPTFDGEPYYPMLTDQDKIIFERYRLEAQKLRNTYFVGRLADFKYYNMDQAVAASLKLFKTITQKSI